MGCLNCGSKFVYAERSRDLDMIYHATLVMDGTEKIIDYKQMNRKVVRVFSQQDVAIAFNEDVVKVCGPKGSEVVVNFTIGR